MTARRMLAGLALLVAVPVAAGCAEAVPGSGTIAADARTSDGGGPTGSSTPARTGEPTGSPAATGEPAPSSSGSGEGGTSPVCDSLDEQAVEDAFGSPVTFSRSQSNGCQIRAEDGRSMIVAVFEYLKLSEYERRDSTKLKVGGHPAIRTSTTILYVARSKDPDSEGLLAAYYSGLREGGQTLAVKVLEQLVGKYAK